MKPASEYNIVIVSSPDDSLCMDEIPALRKSFGGVKLLELLPSETVGGFKSLFASATSLRGARSRASERILDVLSSNTDVIIAYGGGVAASASVCAGTRAGVPVIIRLGRCQVDFEKSFAKVTAVITDSHAALTRLYALARGVAVNGMVAYNVIPAPAVQASFHAVASRALSFASAGNQHECMKLVRAMAVARPDTKIRWICLDAELPEQKHPMPDNFTIAGATSLYEAISREPVDWLIMSEETPAFIPPSVLQALAAGVPVIAVDSPFIEEAVTDDCGVLFGPDPQSEEFVKGLFPYVESDYRMNSLRHGARSRWMELFSPESAGLRLVETICLCLDRK